MKLRLLAPIVATILAAVATRAADPGAAGSAINRLGLDLHRRMATADANLCLSPYSIQNALAMTQAGADGRTRTEMAAVLHLPKDDVAAADSFAAMNAALAEIAKRSAESAQRFGRVGAGEPIAFTVANRLFGQRGFEFRESFLATTKGSFGAPLEVLDFARNAEAARVHINGWVEDQTRKRIRDLIPPGGVTGDTRLVLANAVYLKAPWRHEFRTNDTKPELFHVRGKARIPVPTLRCQEHYGYARRDGYTVVALPYSDRDLQFVVLMPDAKDGLAALEKELTAETLANCAAVESREVILHLPKFRLESASLPLGQALKALGMKSAFDIPGGSADFRRMAAGAGHGELKISEVFHKTFVAVDEKGTEAAAATAVVIATAALREPSKPVEVRVDRPFLFAIQHLPSGACLFLGRVVDPR